MPQVNKSRTVKVFRAQDLGGRVVPSVLIDISVVLPESKTSDVFPAQGKVIADALHSSLPGGTIDHLVCEMLRRRASHLVRSYGSFLSESCDNDINRRIDESYESGRRAALRDLMAELLEMSNKLQSRIVSGDDVDSKLKW